MCVFVFFIRFSDMFFFKMSVLVRLVKLNKNKEKFGFYLIFSVFLFLHFC